MRYVVFFHVPKTAGNSIAQAVKHNVGGQFVNMGHQTYENSLGVWRTQRIPLTLWEPAFKFGFVRNPWARCLAFYFYHAGRPSRDITPTAVGFRKWVSETSMLQTHTPGTMLAPGNMDFVGRFEHLDEDMDELGTMLGHDYSHPIATLNPTFPTVQDETRAHCHWYNKYTEELVRDLGRWEIERFGYTFG